MKRALIGHTGLVGGNLRRQTDFDDHYNSKNIEQIAGKGYELIVCAGAPAVKWKANQEPEADLANLARLMEPLAQASAEHLVLISTVDVYPNPVGVDERTPIEDEGHHPYGRHRHMLEKFVQDRFDHTIVRLPGLFGPGLKKNVIYDFLHDNRVQAIHPDAVFQFYDLDLLWGDLEKAVAAPTNLVNFATEPVEVHEITRRVFGFEFDNPLERPPARYDMRSIHADLFGGRPPYLYDRDEVLEGMRRFVEREGWRRP
jgi:nucleoside-diphosphate-sugar epimerase